MITINNQDFINIIDTSFVNGICFITINNKEYIIKRINKAKIETVFSGNYSLLASKYIDIIHKIIPCVGELGLLEDEKNIYEIQERLNSNLFINNRSIFTWNQILSLYKKILLYINDISEINGLGIDSAIWNFSIDGIAFDFSPPRLLNQDNKSLFTRLGDIDHLKRTYYRCMTKEGMQLSLLTSVFHTIVGEKIIVNGLNNNWKEDLLLILMNYTSNKDLLINNLCNDHFSSFKKHPINIIQNYMGADNLCRILKK